MTEQAPQVAGSASVPSDDNTPKAPLPVPADFRSIIVGMADKLTAEREMLIRALNDAVLIRDFIAFNRIVTAMQGTIRTIDVLTGKTDLLGIPVQKPTVNVDPAPKPDTAAQPVNKGKRGKRVPIQKPDDTPLAAKAV